MDFAAPPIFGRHVALQTGHLAAMQHTAPDFKRKAKTAVDMRWRIKQINEWLQVNYSEYCEEGGVFWLTQEQVLDPTEHHFNNEFDLKYFVTNNVRSRPCYQRLFGYAYSEGCGRIMQQFVHRLGLVHHVLEEGKVCGKYPR